MVIYPLFTALHTLSALLSACIALCTALSPRSAARTLRQRSSHARLAVHLPSDFVTTLTPTNRSRTHSLRNLACTCQACWHSILAPSDGHAASSGLAIVHSPCSAACALHHPSPARRHLHRRPVTRLVHSLGEIYTQRMHAYCSSHHMHIAHSSTRT